LNLSSEAGTGDKKKITEGYLGFPEEIRSGPLINIDETPVQVLKEPGLPKFRQSLTQTPLITPPKEAAR
jgi:hypothetical protein